MKNCPINRSSIKQQSFSSFSSNIDVSQMDQGDITEQGTYLSILVSNAVKLLSRFDEEAFDGGYDSNGQLGPFCYAVADELPFED
jgi:hypothetical protein